MTELGVNVPSLIAYVLNFVILLGILYLLAYKPIIRLLDQRADRIRESLSAADDARQEAANAREALDEQINEARREGQRLLDQSREAADRFRAEEMERAKRVNERMVVRAIELGGTCTGEHGIGFGKIEFLRTEHGEAVSVMRQLKQALDPDNLMNPGKMF